MHSKEMLTVPRYFQSAVMLKYISRHNQPILTDNVTNWLRQFVGQVEGYSNRAVLSVKGFLPREFLVNNCFRYRNLQAGLTISAKTINLLCSIVGRFSIALLTFSSLSWFIYSKSFSPCEIGINSSFQPWIIRVGGLQLPIRFSESKWTSAIIDARHLLE